jgi:hypothetical protein
VSVALIQTFVARVWPGDVILDPGDGLRYIEKTAENIVNLLSRSSFFELEEREVFDF